MRAFIELTIGMGRVGCTRARDATAARDAEIIAGLAPDKALPPAGTFERARARSWLSFLSSTLHASLSAVMFLAPGCDSDLAREAALQRAVAAFQDVEQHLV